MANEGSNSVSVLAGVGDGGFGAASGIPAGTTPYGVTAADFNGDGFLDLALAHIGAPLASLLLAAPADFPAGASTHGTAAGDFNRDGRLDLVVSNRAADSVSVLLRR